MGVALPSVADALNRRWGVLHRPDVAQHRLNVVLPHACAVQFCWDYRLRRCHAPLLKLAAVVPMAKAGGLLGDHLVTPSACHLVTKRSASMSSGFLPRTDNALLSWATMFS